MNTTANSSTGGMTKTNSAVFARGTHIVTVALSGGVRVYAVKGDVTADVTIRVARTIGARCTIGGRIVGISATDIVTELSRSLYGVAVALRHTEA